MKTSVLVLVICLALIFLSPANVYANEVRIVTAEEAVDAVTAVYAEFGYYWDSVDASNYEEKTVYEFNEILDELRESLALIADRTPIIPGERINSLNGYNAVIGETTEGTYARDFWNEAYIPTDPVVSLVVGYITTINFTYDYDMIGPGRGDFLSATTPAAYKAYYGVGECSVSMLSSGVYIDGTKNITISATIQYVIRNADRTMIEFEISGNTKFEDKLFIDSFAD